MKGKLGKAESIADAGLDGFVDAHAAPLSIASQTKAGAFAPNGAVFPTSAAMTSNALALPLLGVPAQHGQILLSDDFTMIVGRQLFALSLNRTGYF